MEEIYRRVNGFENYAVSNLGNVKNIKTNKTIKALIDSHGYYFINLYDSGIRKKECIHRLVAKAFLQQIHLKDVIDHIDGNKLNNTINNLRRVNYAENSYNQKIGKNNTSGQKGISYIPKTNKWQARITFEGKTISLGHYSDMDEAIEARITKANQLFGVFTSICEKN